MKLTLGGIRGTNPVTDSAYADFGGDTTSLLVEGADGTRLIIDLGTGLRNIEPNIRCSREPRLLNIFLTHYHLDHLIGLPAFSPLYDPTWTLKINGPRLDGFHVADVMHRILARPFWPLQMDAMHAEVQFSDLEIPGSDGLRIVGGMHVRWCSIHHPGGCVAYRIDEPTTGASMVFATDIEWHESTDAERTDFFRLCALPKPADVLLFDGQFSPETIVKHHGWGHSTWTEAVEVAKTAGIRRLFVIHHSPERNDSALQTIESEVQKLLASAQLAHQGHAIEITRTFPPLPKPPPEKKP
jgi:ribonuclease BN (tRNA processing enzyme)